MSGIQIANMGNISGVAAGTVAAPKAAQLALIGLGGGLFLLGMGVVACMAYRVFWQQQYPQGGASPWQNNTDLVPARYLQSIQQFPTIYPPYNPGAMPPKYTVSY